MEQRSHRKRICFLTHDLMMGGLENVLIEGLHTLHEKYDIKVIVLYGEFQSVVTDRFPASVEVEYKNMRRTRLSMIPYLSRFYFNKAIGNEHYDFIIGLKNFERYACFCKQADRHIYWCSNDFHTHYMGENLSRQKKRIVKREKLLYRHHDAIWTVGAGIAEESNQLYDTDKFQPLPPSIDCTAIEQKASEPCRDIFDPNKINIVLLGRISPEKGFSRLFKIMPKLHKQFPNAHLHVIGGNSKLDEIMLKLKEKGLDEYITLWGVKTNPFPYLKQAQLFVCPSLFESFGLVMMEAMMVKVPMITTATTGGKYVTQNGKYAQCVENNDDALYDAISTFLQDPGSYSYSLEEAQAWAQQHDVPLFRNRLLKLLEEQEKRTY